MPLARIDFSTYAEMNDVVCISKETFKELVYFYLDKHKDLPDKIEVREFYHKNFGGEV